MTTSDEPLLVCARYTAHPNKFTSTCTIEELLSVLNEEYLPVRDVFVQVTEGTAVSLHQVGSLRIEFISGEPEAPAPDPSPVEPPLTPLSTAQESHEDKEIEIAEESEDSTTPEEEAPTQP